MAARSRTPRAASTSRCRRTRALTRWAGYVCSGTVVTDATTGRSIIHTAGHCVYDDAYKAFARNVLFIPNQAGTTGAGTDLNCSNDPLGCWTPSFGVVDVNWTTRTFPDNVAWDYAYYVFDDASRHSGTGGGASDSCSTRRSRRSRSSFAVPFFDVANSRRLHDCARLLLRRGPEVHVLRRGHAALDAANWWLGSCGLSGGSSGGPWMQPFTRLATGSLISVNSWGYTNQPGMAGPKLSGTTASCVFALAKSADVRVGPDDRRSSRARSTRAPGRTVRNRPLLSARAGHSRGCPARSFQIPAGGV